MEMFLFVLTFTFKAKHNSGYERVKSLDRSCSFYQFMVPMANQGTGHREPSSFCTGILKLGTVT